MNDPRYGNLVKTVVTLLEARNPYNLDHCALVAHYSDGVARHAGLDEASRARLRDAAELHTLGVLLQLEEKKEHARLPLLASNGDRRAHSTHEREEEILRSVMGGVNGLDEAIPIVMQRHEWYDGTGSLMGLSGDAILHEARALAVADAFVDLATPKSHRDPVTLTDVLERLKGQAGTQFDPRYVDALVRAVSDEEVRWGASARARRLDEARCRHWLTLGHFYRQSGEQEWAMRCYRAGEKLAESVQDPERILECAVGQFLVSCALSDLDGAHQTLARVRPHSHEASPVARNWYLLQWGLLEWHRGNEANAEQIVQGVLERMTLGEDVAGLAAATALLSHMALQRRGADDEGHLKLLREFMGLVRRHDVFDVVVTYRPQTIPLLLSAATHDVEEKLARNMLTRMGEPCHGPLAERLAEVPPARWMEALRAAPRPEAPAVAVPARNKEGGLRVLTLGVLRVETEGRAIAEDDWATQKAMKLFAYLVSRHGNAVADQALMELFWPLADEERARNSLRNAVHQVRGALKTLLGEAGAAALTRSRRTGLLGLEIEAFVDSDALEDGVRTATARANAGDHAAARVLLEDVLPLYRGEYLESVRDDWATAPRARISDLHLRGLDMLARCHLALGDAEGAELAARRALACDDLQESAHGHLVEALAAQGRRADALRHYQNAVAHFDKEMGLSAPARLVAIYERVFRPV